MCTRCHILIINLCLCDSIVTIMNYYLVSFPVVGVHMSSEGFKTVNSGGDGRRRGAHIEIVAVNAVFTFSQ